MDKHSTSDEAGDDGSNDLIVSQVVRANELQSWFVVQHLAQRTEQGLTAA